MIVHVPTDSRRVLIDEYPLVIEVYFTQKGLLNYSPIGEECVRACVRADYPGTVPVPGTGTVQ